MLHFRAEWELQECCTLMRLSSEPVAITCELGSTNATAFTSSSCPCTLSTVCATRQEPGLNRRDTSEQGPMIDIHSTGVLDVNIPTSTGSSSCGPL